MKNKSAVMQMFYDARGNGDSVKCSTEYFKYIGEVADYHDKLCEKLANTPELMELLNKLCDSFDAAHSEEVKSYYEEGFNFGLTLGVEAGKS